MLASTFLFLSISLAFANDISTCEAGATADECLKGSSMVQKSLNKHREQAMMEAGGGLLNAMDPVSIEKKVAAMVTYAVNHGGKMSVMNMTLIAEVINMLKTSVQPSIQQTHETEVNTLNSRYNAILDCGADAYKKEYTTLKQSSQKYKNESAVVKNCTTNEIVIENNVQKGCGEFAAWLQDVGPHGPRGYETCPAFPSMMDADELGAWLKENYDYFSYVAPEYPLRSDNCVNMTLTMREIQTTCKTEQQIANEMQCNYCDDIDFANNTYDKCFADTLSAYQDSYEKIQIAIYSRKVEWVAIEKASCYLSVLTAPANQQQAKLTACASLSTNTTWLEIARRPNPVQVLMNYTKCSESLVTDAKCPKWPSPAPTSAPTPAPTPDPYSLVGTNVHCDDDSGTKYIGLCSGATTLAACKTMCDQDATCWYISWVPYSASWTSNYGNMYRQCTTAAHTGRTVYQKQLYVR